jgi:hypothetical protein
LRWIDRCYREREPLDLPWLSEREIGEAEKLSHG